MLKQGRHDPRKSMKVSSSQDRRDEKRVEREAAAKKSDNAVQICTRKESKMS